MHVRPVSFAQSRYEPQCKSMARPGNPPDRDGSSNLRAGGNHSLLARVGVLVDFLGASVLTTLDLMRRDPALLERRMKGGPTAESEPTQKLIMLFASMDFVALLIVPGLDHRLGWSAVPLGGVVAGNVLVAIGFYFIVLVYRENTFASATITVGQGQSVISSGPYAIVRHPMYASASLYLLGTPLALGSYWGIIPMFVMMPVLIWRLIDEERFLAKSLFGYTDYQKRVRHHLVPFVW
jgi:protein-S-isoprenylcysteine O-methyltransferase Ste14